MGHLVVEQELRGRNIEKGGHVCMRADAGRTVLLVCTTMSSRNLERGREPRGMLAWTQLRSFTRGVSWCWSCMIWSLDVHVKLNENQQKREDAPSSTKSIEQQQDQIAQKLFFAHTQTSQQLVCVLQFVLPPSSDHCIRISLLPPCFVGEPLVPVFNTNTDDRLCV